MTEENYPDALNQTLPERGFIRLKKLMPFVPFSKAAVWAKIKTGDFPKPYKISNGITAWDVIDIRAYFDEIRATRKQ